MRLLRMVPLPLWCTEKRIGSVSQRCLRCGLWPSRLHSCPAVATGIAHSQWRGNYFRTRQARPKAPKPGTRNTVVRWNWIVVFCPKNKRSLKNKKKVFIGFGVTFWPKNQRSLKKRSSPDSECFWLKIKHSLIKQTKNNIFAGLEAFFNPKNRPGYKSEGGQKSSRREPKYLQGGSCPLPPTSRAYAHFPAGNRAEPSSTRFLWTGTSPSCKQFSPAAAGLSLSAYQIEEVLTHLLPDCPASEPLRRAIFGTTSSIFDIWSKPWGVARLLGFRGVPLRPHPSEGAG